MISLICGQIALQRHGYLILGFQHDPDPHRMDTLRPLDRPSLQPHHRQQFTLLYSKKGHNTRHNRPISYQRRTRTFGVKLNTIPWF
jgi:hypothetical protein